MKNSTSSIYSFGSGAPAVTYRKDIEKTLITTCAMYVQEVRQNVKQHEIKSLYSVDTFAYADNVLI